MGLRLQPQRPYPAPFSQLHNGKSAACSSALSRKAMPCRCSRWESHVGIADMIRMDDECGPQDASPEITMDGIGAKWRDDREFTDVTLVRGAGNGRARVLPLARQNTMGYPHHEGLVGGTDSNPQKDTRGGAGAYRFRESGSHRSTRARYGRHVALERSTGAYGECLAATSETIPEEDVSINQSMVMVAIHTAAVRLNGHDNISVGEPGVVWNIADLVERDVDNEEEVMDLVAVRQLFTASQATQPRRPTARAGDLAVQLAVAPRRRRPQEKLQRKVAEDALEASQKAKARAKQVI